MSLSFYILKKTKDENRLEIQQINFVAQSTFDKTAKQVDSSGGMIFILYF